LARPFIVSQLPDDLIFTGHHGGQIQTYPAGLDAVIGELIFGKVKVFTGIQQGFAGYAPHVQAHATQTRFFFNARNFQTELGSANRRYIAAGTASNNDNIII
jgi:hypothetical protein